MIFTAVLVTLMAWAAVMSFRLAWRGAVLRQPFRHGYDTRAPLP
jgi:hypothetical protein